MRCGGNSVQRRGIRFISLHKSTIHFCWLRFASVGCVLIVVLDVWDSCYYQLHVQQNWQPEHQSSPLKSLELQLFELRWRQLAVNHWQHTFLLLLLWQTQQMPVHQVDNVHVFSYAWMMHHDLCKVTAVAWLWQFWRWMKYQMKCCCSMMTNYCWMSCYYLRNCSDNNNLFKDAWAKSDG